MGKYSTQEACKIVGISKSTLFQWFKDGKVKDVRRDHRGWRVFKEDDIMRLREFKESQKVLSHLFTGIERRHFTRKNIALPLEYAVRDVPNKPGKNKISIMTSDLGGGGFLIKCNNLLQIEQFMDVTFTFPPPLGETNLLGQVRWIAKSPDQKDHLVGCHFVSINASQRKKVMDFLFADQVVS